MADISKLNINNTEYNIKDATARSSLVDDTTVTTTLDTTPYLYKASGYDAVYDKLVGGTVAFNQLVEHGDFDATTGWNTVRGSLSISDNVGTLSVSEVATTTVCNRIRRTISFINTHKYFVSYDVKVSKAVTISSEATSNSGNAWVGVLSEVPVSANTWTRYEKIKLSSTTASCYFGIGANNTLGAGLTTSDTLQFKNVNLIDLTLLFGTTIADYIYSLEQATTGAGVAYFRNLFPNSYYAYNAGELVSVKTNAHKMTGFNQFGSILEFGNIDNTGADSGTSVNYIRSIGYTSVLPNTKYYFYASTTQQFMQFYVIEYDATKSFIARTGIMAGSTLYSKRGVEYRVKTNTRYIRVFIYKNIDFSSVSDVNICINLSDTSLNGTYKPYQANSYSLASNLELRGIPKLDANNKLYYDGDTYESNGTVTRKYGVVDLGDLTWSYLGTTDENKHFLSSVVADIKHPASLNIIPNILCKAYITNTYNHAFTNNKEISVYTNGNIIIKDLSYSDVQTFATAISGVYLVYELAKPAIESSTPFANPQTVYSKGTEEYIDERDVAIPVGGDRTYVDIPDWMENRYFDDIRSEISLVPEKFNIEKPASGSIASFNNGGDNIPVKSLVVDITAVQAGEGTPSLSNVRTINGFDSVEIGISAKNIWNEQWEAGTINANTGLPEADPNRIRSKNFILCRPSTSYYALPNVQVFGYDEQGNYIGIASSSASGDVFTTPANCHFLKFRTPNTYGGTYNNDLGINYPSTATTYEPYKGTTYTISLGSTVYGGTLDVTKGVLTITHGYKSYSGGFSQATNGIFYIDGTISDADTSSYSIVCLSNCYDYAGVKSATSGMVGQEDKFGVQFLRGLRIMVCDTSFADDTAFNNSLLSTPLQVVYPLATPVVINLTKTQVTTLLNENNIYANSGDISVRYFTQSAKNISDVADSSNKMDFSNPTGTGSLSLNRKAGTTIGSYSITEGRNCIASGNYGSHAEGYQTEAQGEASHAEGNGTKATSNYTHAEGYGTIASGMRAHAEGNETQAIYNQAHAEGHQTIAKGNSSHAEGYQTTSGAQGSHSEGLSTSATGVASHAEGSSTTSSGVASHAEGTSTASGSAAHAEGGTTKASGNYSHSEGSFTIASRKSQHVFGEYNIADTQGADGTAKGAYIEIVGKGSNDANRSNARTLDWSGNETLAGGLKLHTDKNASTLTVTSSIATGATYDFTNFADGAVIFVYRPSDVGQSDYTGIYIRAGNWQRLIPIKEAPNVTTSGYVLTNGNSQALRCVVISI